MDREPYISNTLGCYSQPFTTGTIPSSKPLSSVSIPLRALTSPTQQRDDYSAPLIESTDEKHPGRRSTDSAGSEFSLWSDTGDLAEQLADEEDPLQIKLRESVDGGAVGGLGARARGGGLRHKHVRYAPQDHLYRKNTDRGIDKESIQIPEPGPRQIGRVEKIIATAMTGDRQKSLSQGLTGKPLLYVYEA